MSRNTRPIRDIDRAANEVLNVLARARQADPVDPHDLTPTTRTKEHAT